MNHSIGNWLCNKEEQMTLFEEDGDVTLTNQTNVLLLGAELSSTRTDGVALQYWTRLGTASLAHFQRALAQNRNTGALWLTQRLKGELNEARVLNCVVALLNQRDTWRAIFARLGRPSLSVKPFPLRSQLY